MGHSLNLAALLAVVLALAAPGQAAPAATFEPCGDLECATVSVPLDRSGAVAGTINLHAERERGPGRRGVMLALAGGPGQAASAIFDLSSLASLAGLDGYSFATFDQRGTGRSGALRCPELQGLGDEADPALLPAAGAACAARLGERRPFYTTRDSAEDIEAVRQALGVERIGLYATSYGTVVALAYALRYPDRVERLLLDSAAPPTGIDPLELASIRAIPRVLRSVCAGGACRGATADPVGDLAALAHRLSRRPLPGRVVGPDGRARRTPLTYRRLVSVVAESDVNPALRAALPAAVRDARRGDAAPLLRLARLTRSRPAKLLEFSVGLLAATDCEEAAFPWPRTAPLEARAEHVRAAVAALPESALYPLGRQAVRKSTVVALCSRWPQAPDPPFAAEGLLPDVPVLVLQGEEDLRTPLAWGRQVASLFPRGKLLAVPRAGHSVLSSDLSGCAAKTVRRWLDGKPVPERCPRGRALVAPQPLAPRSLSALRPPPGVVDRAGRTIAAVGRTLDDALDACLVRLLSGGSGAAREAIGGLRGGRFVLRSARLTLRRLQYVPGVWVSGALRFSAGLVGRIEVDGPAAAGGTLELDERGRATGVLGGREVTGPTGLDLLEHPPTICSGG